MMNDGLAPLAFFGLTIGFIAIILVVGIPLEKAWSRYQIRYWDNRYEEVAREKARRYGSHSVPESRSTPGRSGPIGDVVAYFEGVKEGARTRPTNVTVPRDPLLEAEEKGYYDATWTPTTT